jgi:hypothetical protein
MIYVFGDSFSERFSDFVEPCNVSDYVKWKGYSPKMYFDYLSEELGEPISNHSYGGMCNEFILIKFMENYHKIKSSDTVIFGWTSISRYLIPEPKDNRWITNIHETNLYLSQKTKDELDMMRNHHLFIEKQIKIISFIDQVLSNNKTIHWTWSTIPLENCLTIYKETNGEIPDSHYSEEGQKDLYHKISELLKITDKVKLNVWKVIDIYGNRVI